MKIESIKNIGCLRDVSQTDFGQFSFIYGLNGVGKSTLKKLIVESFKEKGRMKQSFGMSSTKAYAKLKILNKEAEFIKGKIKTPINNINLHVFDDEYISETIFENGIIKDSNKVNYYNLFVGKGVSSKVRNLNDRAMQNQIYCKNVSDVVEVLKVEMELIKNVFQEFDKVNKILKKSIYSIDLESDLKIEVLKNISDLGETEVRWLKSGEELSKSDEICPYCGQDISEELKENLIDRYRELNIVHSHYDDEIISYLDYYINQIDVLLNSNNLYYIDVEEKNIRDNLIELSNACKRKVEDIYRVVKTSKPTSFGSVTKKITFIENQILALEKVVDKFKIKDMFSIVIDSDAEKKYINLRSSIRNLFVNENIALEFLSEVSKIRRTAFDCESRIKDIKTNQASLINSNVDFINRKFDEYDFDYMLSMIDVKHKVLSKSNDFLLNLKLTPKGINKTSINLESKKIKECLSEGEKSIVAWVMFLCDIRQQLSSKRHFIILDDPISSYDAFRRFNLIYDLEEVFIKNSTEKELLLLTHEKSFTNSAQFINKMNFFNLQDNVFNKINPSQIIENDLMTDIEFIRDHLVLNNDESLIEFIVRSRNLINYSFMKVELLGTKNFNKVKYEENYGYASEILHMRSLVLPESYIAYVEREFYKIVRNTIKIDHSNLDLTNIDISALLPCVTDNPYINRVIIDKYFQDVLDSNGVNYTSTATTGNLLNLAEVFIDTEKVRKARLIIPILNIFNHPNLNYGVRRIDIDLKKRKLVSDVVQEIIR